VLKDRSLRDYLTKRNILKNGGEKLGRLEEEKQLFKGVGKKLGGLSSVKQEN